MHSLSVLLVDTSPCIHVDASWSRLGADPENYLQSLRGLRMLVNPRGEQKQLPPASAFVRYRGRGGGGPERPWRPRIPPIVSLRRIRNRLCGRHAPPPHCR